MLWEDLPYIIAFSLGMSIVVLLGLWIDNWFNKD